MTVHNILTVDLEDWYHICGVDHLLPETGWPDLESRVEQNTLKILDVLRRRHVTATFFVLGYIADRHRDLIRKIQDDGHEIATHGYAHRRVYTMTPREFRGDLIKAIDAVATITGLPVRGYRAPEWSIRDDSSWALDILQEEGLEYDSSMAPLPIIGNPDYPRTAYRMKLDGGSLWEFPPLTAATPLINLPVGGGWGLRTFPYTVVRAAIQRLNRGGNPAVIFLHPREFDHHNPRVGLPPAKRFVLHARVASTAQRLECLLDDFYFTSISTVLKKKSIAFQG
jgi:polysaccharide deacetylase family protein (PEP-CTERM system associated)